MKYLPILQELFESDTIIFMIIGIVIAVMIGLRRKQRKKYSMAIMISIVIYAVCELVSNIHTNFMLELILLFVGTVSMGCCIGFLICLLCSLLKSRKWDLPAPDYSHIIGTTVKGTIDRPIGSVHPRHPEMVYPINYGYVDGVFAGDGAEQDVYVFGTDKPLTHFEGKVIAVYHRFDDVEDKWIVSLDGEDIAEEKILEDISFQEQFFHGKLYR